MHTLYKFPEVGMSGSCFDFVCQLLDYNWWLKESLKVEQWWHLLACDCGESSNRKFVWQMDGVTYELWKTADDSAQGKKVHYKTHTHTICILGIITMWCIQSKAMVIKLTVSQTSGSFSSMRAGGVYYFYYWHVFLMNIINYASAKSDAW